MNARGVVLAALLVGLTLAVYAPLRHHELVDYDDLIYVLDNPTHRDGLSPASAARAFREPYHANWIPLTSLSFQLDHALWGGTAAGTLLTNLALHAAATVVLFLALLRMTRAPWPSAFTAAVFAVHPLHVESVAWASERKDVLSGLFWMLALHAWAGYARRPAPGRYLLVLLWFALGLLAKPMLVTLPFVLLLLDAWPLRRWPPLARLPRLLLEKLPLLAPALAVAVVTLAVQRESGSTQLGEVLSYGARLANALESYAIYLGQSLWPSGLAVFYPHPGEPASVLPALAAGALLVALTAASLALARSRPYLAVGWLWFLGTLVPVIGLVQVGWQARADRYTYLPQVGLAIALAWGALDFAGASRRRRAVVAGFGVAAVLGLAAAAALQTRHWRDTETLFSRALAVTEENFFAHQVRGQARLAAGQLDAAEADFRAAATYKPEWARPPLGLADVLVARGRVDAALPRYAAVIRRFPNDDQAAAKYGLALLRVARFAEARAPLERALQRNEGSAELHAGLALVDQHEGRAAAAIRHNRDALRLDPLLRSAANNLAWLLATSPDPELRDPEGAIRMAGQALAGAPDDPALLDTLAAAYAAADRFDEAVATALRAVARAETAGSPALVSGMRQRLALYRAGTAYVE